MRDYLLKIAEGQSLTSDEAEAVMNLLLKGASAPEETAALLMGLRSRGETLDELTGFTKAMRAHAVAVEAPDDAIDLCGTGGDHAGSFNISTAASFVAAGAGVPVAKHGNRAVSSNAGSADVLDALGVDTTLGKDGVEACLRETGIAFLFAPLFHPALRHVMPVRRALGTRTFFNILGPLCNPAGVRRQLVGAFSDETAKQMAQILVRLGSEHVVCIYAHDGLDELSTTSPTTVYQTGSQLDPFGAQTLLQQVVMPEHYGLARVSASELSGGTAEENADIVRLILDGQAGAARDIVLLNAAYALLASGRFEGLAECLAAAGESIDSGAARKKLDLLAQASRDFVPAAAA
jgi:anthranilate phosphoribosyltransferase